MEQKFKHTNPGTDVFLGRHNGHDLWHNSLTGATIVRFGDGPGDFITSGIFAMVSQAMTEGMRRSGVFKELVNGRATA